MATQITEGVVPQSPFIASLAKVLLVGGLMAGGAAGIYVLAETRGDGDTERLQVLGAEPADTTTLVAGTATPEETPTPTVVAEPTASPTWWATPSSPDEPMLIGGSVWVNARPARVNVRALIDGTVCAETLAGTLPDSYGTDFYLLVPSQNNQPGCGYPGANVRFEVDGALAQQEAAWSPGPRPPLVLFVGPEFSQYYGEFTYSGSMIGYKVEPVIAGNICGVQINPSRGSGEYGYHLVVDSAEQSPGCGQPGAVVAVRLTIELKDGPPIVIESLASSVWMPYGGIHTMARYDVQPMTTPSSE